MGSRGRHIAAVIAREWIAAAAQSRFGLASASRRRAAFARHTRQAFERLGPTFVKLGQVVSVRPEEFPDELVAEMARLRDAAPPLATDEIERVVYRQFRRTPDELWDAFDPVPLASASVAQVHRARLRSAYRPVWGDELAEGAEVAVKIVRPDAAAAVFADLDVARALVRFFRRLGLAPAADPDALLDEFAASVARELDVRNEGRVADRFAFDFHHDPHILVPRVVWPLTGRSVITMEYVDGWPLSAIAEASAAGVDCRDLAYRGAVAFMRQVFVLGRYHADLHPANLLVTPDGRIAYLDFGIVGELTAAERHDMAQVMAALVYRDIDRALTYSARLGVRVPEERLPAVRGGLAELLGGARRTDGTLDVRYFGLGMLRLLATNGVKVPAGYGLLVKSLVTVEGVARALYPEIDIIEVARPFTTGVLANDLLAPERVRERLPAAMRAALRELIS